MLFSVSRPKWSLALTVIILNPGETINFSLHLPFSSVKIGRSFKLIQAMFFALPRIVTNGWSTTWPSVGCSIQICGPIMRKRA